MKGSDKTTRTGRVVADHIARAEAVVAEAALALRHEHPELDDLMPMGGTPVIGGATFRAWAPRARAVYLLCKANDWKIDEDWRLDRRDDETWVGLAPGLKHLDQYQFYVFGPESDHTGGYKRDPYARELSESPGWPRPNSVLYDPNLFPWHDRDFRPPSLQDLILYQLHLGTWHKPQANHNGGFLDVIDMLDYFTDLGINALQPLPIVEFPTRFSMGYNGVDYFSPENDYGVYDDRELRGFLDRINERLTHMGHDRLYELSDLTGTAAQFRAMIDLCHVYGIAVILDVVYNHAGGDFGEESIYFFDRAPDGDNNNSLYFTSQGLAGGLIFAYWNEHVRQFLIDNARYYVDECHADGFRYDEVSVILREGGENGRRFCCDLTNTVRHVKPQAIQIAEHWPVDNSIVKPTDWGGTGFDATQSDGLREAIRTVVRQAADGPDAAVDLDRLTRELYNPRLADRRQAVNCIENHDIVYRGRGARMPWLADTQNSRSWYATSRSRVALGLLLTAPGVPHLFMGQEFLEDKQWHDDYGAPNLLYWDGLFDEDAPGHRHMVDFRHFTRDLIALRRRLPALRSEAINVFYHHSIDRIIAFHRWVPGEGRDIVVVASLRDHTFYDYRLGFPHTGRWTEAFNSDVYEAMPNPNVAGNAGHITASPHGMHGFAASASLTIPANGVLIFAFE